MAKVMAGTKKYLNSLEEDKKLMVEMGYYRTLEDLNWLTEESFAEMISQAEPFTFPAAQDKETDGTIKMYVRTWGNHFVSRPLTNGRQEWAWRYGRPYIDLACGQQNVRTYITRGGDSATKLRDAPCGGGFNPWELVLNE